MSTIFYVKDKTLAPPQERQFNPTLIGQLSRTDV